LLIKFFRSGEKGRRDVEKSKKGKRKGRERGEGERREVFV